MSRQMMVAVTLLAFTALVPVMDVEAGWITAQSIEGTGTWYHDKDLIIDGTIPPEKTHWQDAACVYWYGINLTFHPLLEITAGHLWS